MRILITVYTFAVLWLFLKSEFLFAIICITFIPFVVLFLKLRRKFLVDCFAKKIAKAQEDFKNGVDFEPFININSRPWYILKLIPGVSQISAKKLQNHIRKNAPIKDFTEFANFCSLEIAFYELDKKIIRF